MMVKPKIISGGQTGIACMALEVAKALGFPTGGTAPKNFMTELGPDDSLKTFVLTEHTIPGCPPRTEQNVLDSDATLLFGNDQSNGSVLTARLSKSTTKPA